MTERTALVFGVSGQDGSLLAKLLLEEGYAVVGTSRDAQMSSFANLEALGIRDAVTIRSAVPTDFRSVLEVLRSTRPDEIYFLSGQSSVGLSFEQPLETMESVAVGTLNLLEAVRLLDRPVRLYNAASGECFGSAAIGAHERTRFEPRSPYAVAKASAFWTVANYREAYGLHACSGILFNHDSPLRPERFVTRKIVRGAYRIARGEADELVLGNLDIERDWGWAPDYVRAMHLMLQTDRPEDLVIASGAARPLRDFVRLAFEAFGLDWTRHVRCDAALLRPTDLARSFGDPSRAAAVLGWSAGRDLEDVVRLMAAAEAGEPWPAVSGAST